MTAEVYASGRLNYTSSVNKWTMAADSRRATDSVAMRDLLWFTSYASSRVKHIVMYYSTTELAVFP